MALTRDLSVEINNNYVMPLLTLLIQKGLSVSAVMNILKREYDLESRGESIPASLSKQMFEQIIAFEYRLTPHHFQALSLDAKYLEFKKLYFGQVPAYKHLDVIAMQTLIRDLMHQHLLPERLMFMSEQALRANMTIDQEAPIFYVLGNDVSITDPRGKGLFGFFDASIDIKLKLSIPNATVFKSILNLPDDHQLTVCHTLSQAIECANYKQHGGQLLEGEGEGFIPSIWAVTCLTPNNLVFEEQAIQKNANSSHSSPRALIETATVSREAITPLAGVVLYSRAYDFMNYTILNTIEPHTLQAKLDEPERKKNCAIM